MPCLTSDRPFGNQHVLPDHQVHSRYAARPRAAAVLHAGQGPSRSGDDEPSTTIRSPARLPSCPWRRSAAHRQTPPSRGRAPCHRAPGVRPRTAFLQGGRGRGCRLWAIHRSMSRPWSAPPHATRRPPAGACAPCPCAHSQSHRAQNPQPWFHAKPRLWRYRSHCPRLPIPGSRRPTRAPGLMRPVHRQTVNANARRQTHPRTAGRARRALAPALGPARRTCRTPPERAVRPARPRYVPIR